MNINVLMLKFGFSSEYPVVGGILTPSEFIGFDPSTDLVVQTYSKSEGFALQSYNHGIVEGAIYRNPIFHGENQPVSN